MIFLAEAVLDGALDAGVLAGILALIAAFLILALVIGIGVYIYTSFAFSAIAKKARYSLPAIAWIPVVGPLLITSSVAKMHWWPILLLLGAWIPIVGGLIMLALAVFSIIWLWKTFEAIKKPGWWAILCLIPIVSLVLIGIAAWSKK